MKNHDILFDKDNKRLGFVRADCSADYSFDPDLKVKSGGNYIGTNNLLIYLI